MKIALIAAVCAALLSIYAIGFAAPGFDVYHDDGIYLVSAKALAVGAGYKIISLPQPIAQTRFPPFFPLALASAWKIFPKFPENIYLLKIVPLGFAVAWLWVCFAYLREKFGEARSAAWIVLFSAASPWLLFSSVAFMSETMFAFFLTAALLVVDRMNRQDHVAWPKLFLASAAAAAAILTRTAGLPLILAGAGALLIKRKFKAAGAYPFAVAVMVSPWWIWSSRHGGVEGTVNAYYGGSIYANLNLLSDFSWSQRVRVLGTNVASTIISPGGLMGFPLTALGFLLCLLLAGLVIYGFFLDIRKEITALNLFVVFYEGMLLLWPWPSVRFLGPVLPFLLYFAFLGVLDIVRKFPKIRFPAPTVAAWACALLLLPFASLALARETQATLHYRTARFPFEERKNWAATLSAMDWVNRNTSPQAVLLGDDATIYLLTGRHAIGLFSFDPFAFSYSQNHDNPFGTPREFIANLLRAKVDYALYASDSTGAQSRAATQQIEKAATDHPGAFTRIEAAGVRNYVIYSIDRKALEGDAHN